MASTSRWAIPDEGSSSRITDGWIATTAARSTSRRDPVDSSLTRLSAKRSSPKSSISSSTRCITAASVRTCIGSRKMALNGSPTSVKRSNDTASASRTVNAEKRRESWNDRPSPSRRARRGRAVGDVDAGHPDPTRVRTEEARDHVEECRLPGAVGPDDADDLPVTGMEGDVIERGVAPERHRDASHFELGSAAARRRARRSVPATGARWTRRPFAGRSTTTARDATRGRRRCPRT